MYIVYILMMLIIEMLIIEMLIIEKLIMIIMHNLLWLMILFTNVV